MKAKTFVLNFEFFKTALLVHFGTVQSCRKILDNYNLSEEEKMDIVEALGGKPANGMVWSGNKGRMLMFLGFPPRKRFENTDLAVLAHECLHVAFGLLEYCGIPTTDNEELLCMTQQTVFNSILQKL